MKYDKLDEPVRVELFGFALLETLQGKEKYGNHMRDFKEVIKLRRIPATFLLRCSLCDFEISDYDWHLGLIKMNDHVTAEHPAEVRPLDTEELYSRKPTIRLDSF